MFFIFQTNFRPKSLRNIFRAVATETLPNVIHSYCRPTSVASLQQSSVVAQQQIITQS